MVEKIHIIIFFCYAKRRIVLITTIILQLDRIRVVLLIELLETQTNSVYE